MKELSELKAFDGWGTLRIGQKFKVTRQMDDRGPGDVTITKLTDADHKSVHVTSADGVVTQHGAGLPRFCTLIEDVPAVAVPVVVAAGQRWVLEKCGCEGVVGSGTPINSLNKPEYLLKTELTCPTPMKRADVVKGILDHKYLRPHFEGARLVTDAACDLIDQPFATGQRRRGVIRGVANNGEVEFDVVERRAGKPTGWMVTQTSGAYVGKRWSFDEDWGSVLVGDAAQVAGGTNSRSTVTPVAERRQVSHSGGKGSWVDYDSMADADGFDTYEHRRLISDGKVTRTWGEPAPKTVLKPVALDRCAWRTPQAPGSTNMIPCSYYVAHGTSKFCETHVAEDMRRRDAARAKPIAGPARFVQSHTGGFVGVWSTRDEG